MHAPPSVDEKLVEEEGSVREKNDAMAVCRKYIGQMMLRLGILVCLMVRRPMEVKTHLVCLWRYLWTTIDYSMCTLPSPIAAQKIQRNEQMGTNSPSAQGGPQPWQSSLKSQTYCGASLAPGGGRSRSGILVT